MAEDSQFPGDNRDADNERSESREGSPANQFDPTLRPIQLKALELLLSGKTVAETATAVGLSVPTIRRWLKDDTPFKTAYHQWHEELRQVVRSRLMLMTDKAIEAIEKALEAGDAKIAMQLLRSLGILKRPRKPRRNPPGDAS